MERKRKAETRPWETPRGRVGALPGWHRSPISVQREIQLQENLGSFAGGSRVIDRFDQQEAGLE
jgi:hypothetical protein